MSFAAPRDIPRNARTDGAPAFQANAEPAEILVDRLLEFGTAADRIDILDAQQNSAAGFRARSKLSIAEKA